MLLCKTALLRSFETLRQYTEPAAAKTELLFEFNAQTPILNSLRKQSAKFYESFFCHFIFFVDFYPFFAVVDPVYTGRFFGCVAH